MGHQAFAKLIGSISRAFASSSWTHTRQYAAAATHPPLVVFVDKNTRVICQGIKGKNGTFHTKQAIEWFQGFAMSFLSFPKFIYFKPAFPFMTNNDRYIILFYEKT